MYRGAMLVYDCNPGYSLDGMVSIYCDGRRWNTEPPACVVATSDPDMSCDFEDPDLCGWTHDPNHDFDWKRNQFATPSGHDGTGPSYDHTFGVGKGGFYLYLEASSPRKTNDTTRLFSPVYPPDYSDGCFTFWYHMYGASTGGLRVYLKHESQVFGEIAPAWEKFGEQGNLWLSGHITIPSLHENFQIVIEGIRGSSYVGDTAIDDVLLSKNDCESMENTTDTVAHTVAESCRGRCREPAAESSCGCNENCWHTDTCCNDYSTLCTIGNDTLGENPDEPLPEEELGKTSSPVTVTMAKLTSLASTEILPQHSRTEIQGQFTIESSTTTASTASIAPTTIFSSVPSLSSFSTATVSTSQAIEITSYTTLSSTAVKVPITVESKTSELVKKAVSEKPSSVSTPSLTTKMSTVPIPSLTATKSNVSTLALTTKMSTVSKPSSTIEKTTVPKLATTHRLTTALTLAANSKKTTVLTLATSTKSKTVSTTQAMPTTSVVPTLVTTISSTSRSVPISLSSQSSIESTSRTITLPTLPNVTVYSDISKPSVITSITITPSTRKTYNLRPRPLKTTISLYSEVNSNSTASNSSPMISTTNSQSTPGLVTNSPVITTSAVPTKDEHDHHGVMNGSKHTDIYTSATTRGVLSPSASSTTVSTTFRSSDPSTIKLTTVTANRPTMVITAKTWYTRPSTTKLPFRVPEAIQTTLLTTMSSQEYHSSKSAATSSNSPIVTIISITVVVIICVSAGLYYMKKQKAKRRSKLSEDSEMRFLSDNEEMEYSDASVLDKILVK